MNSSIPRQMGKHDSWEPPHGGAVGGHLPSGLSSVFQSKTCFQLGRGSFRRP